MSFYTWMSLRLTLQWLSGSTLHFAGQFCSVVAFFSLSRCSKELPRQLCELYNQDFENMLYSQVFELQFSETVSEMDPFYIFVSLVPQIIAQGSQLWHGPFGSAQHIVDA